MNALASVELPSGWTLIFCREVESADTRFTSLGADPQLIFMQTEAYERGWYRLRIRAEGLRSPALYLDSGNGMSEEDRQDCAVGAAGDVDVVVHVDALLRHVRFDPMEREGQFRIFSMRFEPIPASEAVWRMWRELASFAESDIAFEEKSLEERAWTLWTSYRRAPLRDAREDYRLWLREAPGDELPVLEQTVESDCILTLVLLPDGHSTELRTAIEHLLEELPANVELLVPPNCGAPGSSCVRLLDSTVDLTLPGLVQAQGQYIGWISADERLPSNAISFIVAALADSGACVLYTDEDFLDDGLPTSPYFKPAWDPGLQAQHDFVGASAFYRTDLVLELQHAVRGDGAAWAHLLPLRVASIGGDAGVLHLPMQARRHLHTPGPVHAPLRSSPAPAGAVVQALRRMRPQGACGAHLAVDTGMPRLEFELPEGTRCEIVIPTRDNVELLRACVESIFSFTEGVDYGIAIVDNGSQLSDTLSYLDRLRSDPRVRIIHDDAPFNFSALNNHAAAGSDADVLVLLNNDIEITESGWLRELAAHACRREVGAVGAKLVYPDGSLQHAGVVLGVGGIAAHAMTRQPRMHAGQFGRALAAQRFSAVTAACLAVRREVFEHVGGLDEELAVAFNDVDLCLRIDEAGFRNLWLPWVWMYHHESASRGYEDNPEKMARFQGEIEAMKLRWGDTLTADPAYSPNLSLHDRAFAIDSSRHARRVPRAYNKAVRPQ